MSPTTSTPPVEPARSSASSPRRTARRRRADRDGANARRRDGRRARAGRRDRVQRRPPVQGDGALAVLRGNLAPDGSLVKAAGATRSSHRGPARVFDSEEACADAVRAGLVRDGDVLVVRYEGPAGGPRHARDAERHLVGGRRRPRRQRRARDRRTLLRRDTRADGRPRRARGSARRPARSGARRRHDLDRRRRPVTSASSSTTTSSQRGSLRGRRPSCRMQPASSAATARSSARRPKAPSSGTAEPAVPSHPASWT